MDESQNGSDPDPNGDGIPDESDPTPINFEQVLNIGLAKNVVSAVVNNDGTFSITYEFNIENFSTVVIDSIQVVDDLGAAFPGPCSVAVTELTSDDFLVNPAYDGVTDINLLLGSDDLVVDDKGAILLSILVSDCGILGPFENNATLTGEGPGGVPLVDAGRLQGSASRRRCLQVPRSVLDRLLQTGRRGRGRGRRRRPRPLRVGQVHLGARTEASARVDRPRLSEAGTHHHRTEPGSPAAGRRSADAPGRSRSGIDTFRLRAGSLRP